MAPITVGFLGLGIMGTAMARNLLKKKGELFTDVVVWNRTLSKVRYRTTILQQSFHLTLASDASYYRRYGAFPLRPW